MLERYFQDSGKIVNDAFATYHFFLQPKPDELFKRRETMTLALRDFNIQEAILFIVMHSLAKILLLKVPP